jgi:superfamily II DNA helicase RecQ
MSKPQLVETRVSVDVKDLIPTIQQAWTRFVREDFRQQVASAVEIMALQTFTKPVVYEASEIRARLVPIHFRLDLQELLNHPDADFKSAEQAFITSHFASCHLPSLLAVMPTGSGKTMTFALPAYQDQIAERPGFTLVLVPYIGLAQNHLETLKRFGIRTLYYDPGKKGDGMVPGILNQGLFSAVIMTYDTFAHQAAQNELSVAHHHYRTALDEGHVLYTDTDWRHILTKVYSLIVRSKKPFVLLSGSLPPLIEGALIQRFYPSPIAIVRMPTPRPNLKYQVRSFDTEGSCLEYLPTYLQELKVSSPLTSDDQWMLFAMTKANVAILKDLVEKVLGEDFIVVGYHSEMPATEREQNLQMFLSGNAVRSSWFSLYCSY